MKEQRLSAGPNVWQSPMQDARKALIDEHDVVLVTVPNVGYRVAAPEDKAGITDGYLKQAYRRAKKGKKVIDTVNESQFKAMSQVAQETHIQQRARVVIATDQLAPRRLKESTTVKPKMLTGDVKEIARSKR